MLIFEDFTRDFLKFIISKEQLISTLSLTSFIASKLDLYSNDTKFYLISQVSVHPVTLKKVQKYHMFRLYPTSVKLRLKVIVS